MDIFSYFPGQNAQIIFELLTSDGYRADSLTVPTITQILGFTSEDGYANFDGYFSDDGYTQPLIKVETGLYFGKLVVPKTAGSLGTYAVEVQYTDPEDVGLKVKTYYLMISAPYGLIGTTTF